MHKSVVAISRFFVERVLHVVIVERKNNKFVQTGIISNQLTLFHINWHYFKSTDIISNQLALFQINWHYFKSTDIISNQLALFQIN
jgi:hypothetical protein